MQLNERNLFGGKQCLSTSSNPPRATLSCAPSTARESHIDGGEKARARNVLAPLGRSSRTLRAAPPLATAWAASRPHPAPPPAQHCRRRRHFGEGDAGLGCFLALGRCRRGIRVIGHRLIGHGQRRRLPRWWLDSLLLLFLGLLFQQRRLSLRLLLLDRRLKLWLWLGPRL